MSALTPITEYRNSFFDPVRGHDPEIYKTDAKPVEYKGCLIYHRMKGAKASQNCWDVVKEGVCIGQYGGLAGCKAFVDRGCVRLGDL